MDICRNSTQINRRKTKEIKVGNVSVGGESKVSVQSMTNTLTTNIKETIKQIHLLEEAGADIVRVSCPDEESTKALKDIVIEPISTTIDLHREILETSVMKEGSYDIRWLENKLLNTN